MNSLESLVQAIHAGPVRVVLVVAGGGSRAIAYLLEVPGASRTLLEAVVPYAPAAMCQWLGAAPEQFCSEATARAMAMAAWLRARRLDPANPVAGVSCTASLATDRPKRGAHRAAVALQTVSRTAVYGVELVKGRRSRAEEETLVTDLVLNAVAEACELSQRRPVGLLSEEPIHARSMTALREWQELMLGLRAAVRQRGAEPDPQPAPPAAVYPGAFHPLHRGHRRIMELAERILGVALEPEISILNVDKPPLDYLEIACRLEQFGAQRPVWLTRAATFEEKSRLFAGATFVVGADTLRRITEPRYYGGDARACQGAIERIAGRGCRFLVFGRAEQGRFITLDQLDLPAPLRAICQGVPEADFRDDICSTELRRRG